MPKAITVVMNCKNGNTHFQHDDWEHRYEALQMECQIGFHMGPRNLPPDTLNVFLVPEYYFRKTGTDILSAYSDKEFKSICAALKNQSRLIPNFLLIGGSIFWTPKDKKIVRHTVPIYHAGREILLYDKRNNCDELNTFERNAGYRWQKGTASGRFTVDGLRCGIETCVDQDYGELAKGGRDLHLHCIVSNMTVVAHPAAAPTGFVLHCNANGGIGDLNINTVLRHPHTPVGNQATVPALRKKGLTSIYTLEID